MNTVRSSDGTTIAFDRSGEGDPVVLVGGAMADRAAATSVAARLAERFTVIAYDRRGRGDSGDTAPYAVDREIDDIAALIAEVGGSAFVFGHSSGAVLALDAAARGVGIEKLALYEPPCAVDDTRPALPADYVAHLDELVAAGRRGDAVEYFLTVAVLVPPEAVAGMRQGEMWPALEAVAHTISYDGRISMATMTPEPLPADRWASVTIPTLVMDGDESPPWMRNGVRALTEVLPNARQQTLAGQDHGPADDVLVPVLEGFFTGVSERPVA
jgi:pimeloyl-ACP methyl ester carboxylesterase